MSIKSNKLFVVRIILVLAFLTGMYAALPAKALGATYYVKWDSAGADNGTSWVDAFTSLQSAITAASNGDEIWVAAGTYKPTSGMDRAVSFTLKNGVAIYGGFAGIETNQSQRDFTNNLTVLSGDIGAAGVNTDNSYHVVVGSNTNNATILDGFTIIDGYSSNTGTSSYGGGLYNYLGSPTLSNLIFKDNSAYLGGGMYSEGDFSGYTVARPSLTNVTFINNTGRGEGGGMENRQYSQPILTNVSFIGNRSNRSGGGMLNLGYCDSILTNVTFSGNTAELGGGLSNLGSNSTLTNVTFNNNVANGWGGGMDNAGNGNTTLTNVTFKDNSTTGYGGAISNHLENVGLTLTNVTINGNSAGTLGDGVYNDDAILTIRNSIIHGNGEEIYGFAAVTNSIIQGGYPGTGNLDADPLLGPLQDHGGFTQTMSLLPGSPAIDAGDNVNCPATDQRGVTRPQGSHCDIGAYEYSSFLPTFEWNTFQGGALDDSASDIAIDPLGNVYITGKSNSAQWEGNPINPLAGGDDAFAAKFNPEGQLLWYTFLGSTLTGNYSFDEGSGITMDDNGNVYIIGRSYASWGENPIHAFTSDTTTNDPDVFVAKLDSNGNLLWHTFFGGNDFDSVNGIVLDEYGDIYITGWSRADWGNTVPDPLNPFSGEYPDANGFVAKLAPSGMLLWHTFLGAAAGGSDIVIEGNGDIYIAGGSRKTWGNSPIRNFAGEEDGFVAKLNSAGELIWNTFLGGTGWDAAWSLVTDGSGNVLVTGYASSSWGDNPIHPYSGFVDGFLAKLDANGNLEWNTFFGGTGFDQATDVVVNNADQTIVVIGYGETVWGDSPLFPYNADGKHFVAQFHPDGVLQWNAFFGQSVYNSMLPQSSLAIQNGNILATGCSMNSWGTPVHDYNTRFDAYVLKMKLGNTSPVITQTIPLHPGWNLVSFNVHPIDTSVSSVLSSIAGNYDLVYAWDATGAHAASGNWLRADNLPESPDSLTSLNEAMGFWIHMTAADTLEIVGTIPQSTNVSLLDNAGGWNLVGYPSNATGSLPSVLSDHGVGTDFSMLYAYHPEDSEDVWKIYDTSVPPFINDLTQLIPGFGYWVKVKADHDWVVEYGIP